MSLYYRTLIQSGRLLDQYPNAAVAYSLRKLRESYTGSAIRVRRNVDSAELDIGFTSTGDLDTNAIVNFFGNNLLLQSENFEVVTSGWARTGANVIAGSIVGPNGVDLSCKFDETSTSGFHILTATQFTTTIGRNYLFSIYLKAGERNVIDFVSLVDATNTCRLNLTTGAIVSNNFTNTPTLTNVGNGWWKFELIVTASNALTSTGFQLRLTNGTSQSYVGNVGWGCYVWGAQVSGYIGNPVPYFRTTTASAVNVFVHTWYDQSGNGINAIQTNPSIQGAILRNGVIILNNNKPIISLSTNFYSLSSSPGNLTGSNFGVNVVNKTTASNLVTFGNTAIGGRPRFPIWTSTGDISINTVNIGNDAGLGTRLITPYVIGGTGGAFVNGAVLNTPIPMTDQPTTNATTIGRFTSTGGSIGNYQEMIWWKQNLLSVRTGIEQNINEYYAIY